MKYPKMNFVKLLKPYTSGWVAISNDFKKVVYHGNTLDEAMKKAKGHKKRLYYFPAGENYSNYFGPFTE